MAKIRDDEIYPNQPLVDVACEIRFPGEMSVLCDLDKFWQRIRDDYPTIYVPHAKEGKPPALQHYRFCTDAPKRTVSVALNSLAYSEVVYRGHEVFIQEFLRVAAEFKSSFPRIDKLNRIGWRYVNVISFMREEGLIPVKRLLNFEVVGPQGLFNTVTQLDTRLESRQRDGTAIVRLAAVARKDQPTQEGLLLDLDFGIDGPNLRLGDLSSHIVNARKFCRGVFEDLITDEYREYLRGTTL